MAPYGKGLRLGILDPSPGVVPIGLAVDLTTGLVGISAFLISRGGTSARAGNDRIAYGSRTRIEIIGSLGACW